MRTRRNLILFCGFTCQTVIVTHACVWTPWPGAKAPQWSMSMTNYHTLMSHTHKRKTFYRRPALTVCPQNVSRFFSGYYFATHGAGVPVWSRCAIMPGMLVSKFGQIRQLYIQHWCDLTIEARRKYRCVTQAANVFRLPILCLISWIEICSHGSKKKYPTERHLPLNLWYNFSEDLECLWT